MRALKIVAKVIGWTLVAVLSLVVLVLATLFIGIRTDAGARFAVRIGLGITNEIFAGKITVGRLHTNLWSGLEIDDATLRDADGELAAHVDKLIVKFSILPLLGSNLRVTKVDVIGARGIVRNLHDGRINFAALLKPSVPTPPRPDSPASKFRVSIDDVNVDAIGRYEAPPGVALPPLEGRVHVSGSVGIGGGDVRVKVTGVSAKLDAPGALTLAAHGGLLVQDGNVTFDETQAAIDTTGSIARAFVKSPEVLGKYHIDVDGKGPLTALNVVVGITTPSRPIKVEGQLRIGETFGWTGHVVTKDLDPEPIVIGAPHALVSLDVKGESTPSGATLAVARAEVEAAGNKVTAIGGVKLGTATTANADVQIAAPNLGALKGRGLPKLSGSIAGMVKLKYAPTEILADVDLSAKDLDVPGVEVRQLSVKAHTKNVGGHVVLVARDVRAGSFSLDDTRVQFDGDPKSFLLHVGATGDHGSSIDFALTGTPRYEHGPIPAGITTTLTVLDIDRNGERWHTDPGAVIAYDNGVSVQRFHARSQRQSLAIDAKLDKSFSTVDADVHAVGLDLNRIAALIGPADTVPHSKLDLSVQAKGLLSHPIADVALAGTVTRSQDKPEEQVHANVNVHLAAKSIMAKANIETDAGKIALDAALPFVTSAKTLFASTAPLDLKIDASVKSLAELWDTVGWKPPSVIVALESRLALSIALSGTGRAPVLHAELDGDGMRYGPMHDASLKIKIGFAADKLDTKVTLSLGSVGAFGTGQPEPPAGVLTVSASLPVVLARMLGPGSLRDKVGANSPLHAEVRMQKIALASLPLGPLGIAPLVDAGHLDGQIDIGGVIGDPTFRMALDGQGLKKGVIDHIDIGVGLESYNRATQVSALVAIEEEPVVSVKAHANHDLGAFLANASLKDTIFDATVIFPGFQLNKLADTVPGLSGALKGKVYAKGTLLAPTASGSIAIDQLAFGGTRFDRFSLDGSYAKAKMSAELNAHEPAGSNLKGTFSLTGKNLVAALEADKLAIDFESLSDAFAVRRFKGALDIHVAANGALPNPIVNGYVELDKATLAVVADPREISDLGLRIDISPNLVVLKKLSGKLGSGGTFDVNGQTKLAGFVPQSLDVHVLTKSLLALQNPVSVAVDSKIDIHGDKQGNTFVGTIKLDKGSAKLRSLTNIRALQDTGPLKDVVYVDAKQRKKDRKRAASVAKAEAGQSMDIAIETKIPGPFHVHSEELNVDLKGDLSIKVHGPDVGLSGQIEALNGGRATLFDKRYDIEKLRVGFDGSAVIDPELDVRITRDANDALIGVEVTGSASKPNVHFISNPPIYSDSQVMLALLGTDPGEPTDNTPLGDKIGGAVSGLIVGQIKNQLAPHLPIDVIKVDVGDTPDFSQTRLEIGKYIKRNVYVSYAHQFGQLLIGTRILSANEGSVEYRFKRNYAVDLTIGDAPEGKADLYWTLRF